MIDLKGCFTVLVILIVVVALVSCFGTSEPPALSIPASQSHEFVFPRPMEPSTIYPSSSDYSLPAPALKLLSVVPFVDEGADDSISQGGFFDEQSDTVSDSVSSSVDDVSDVSTSSDIVSSSYSVFDKPFAAFSVEEALMLVIALLLLLIFLALVLFRRGIF